VSNKKGHNNPETDDLHTFETDMIRTLRITSILVVALAAVLVVFSVVFGVRGDKDIEGLLSEPGVIEKFDKSADNKTARGKNEVSPLVQQAGAFALYLNPPEPKVPRTTSRSPSIRRTPSVAPKFEVIATSYYKDRPEWSIALIDEPGKGRNWVRQSSKVGHLSIVEIKDGVVVVKDSSGTFEIAVEQKPHISLLAGSPAVSSKGAGVSGSTAGKTDLKTSTVTPVESSRYSGRAIPRTSTLPQTSLSRENKKQDSGVKEEITTRFTQLQKHFEKNPNLTKEEKALMMNKVIDEIRALRFEELTREDKD
jgi:hypothetical protein